jgi:hypothetical protein
LSGILWSRLFLAGVRSNKRGIHLLRAHSNHCAYVFYALSIGNPKRANGSNAQRNRNRPQKTHHP